MLQLWSIYMKQEIVVSINLRLNITLIDSALAPGQPNVL